MRVSEGHDGTVLASGVERNHVRSFLRMHSQQKHARTLPFRMSLHQLKSSSSQTRRAR